MARGEIGVSAGDQGEFAGVFVVSPEFFRVMRVAPLQGRLFSREEEFVNGAPAVLVSAAFARSHYGSVQAAIGRTLRTGFQSSPIVGVIEEGFHYPIQGTTRADVWLPAGAFPESPFRTGHNYRAIARLKPNVSIERAQAEMTTIATRLQQAYPKENTDKQVLVSQLQDSLTRTARSTLWLLMGAVGLLLLLACANVANMLLARAASRTKEFALRAAVGASRWDIVRQLLVESSVLSLAAGVAGLAFAVFATDFLLSGAPPSLPRADEIRVDASVVAFLAVASALATFAFGLVPALRTSRIDLNEVLKQGGQRGTVGGRSARLRNGLVVGEIALSLVLMTGAGLLFRSFVKLVDVDMGFRPEHLLVVSTSVPAKDLESSKSATRYYRELMFELRSVAGIKSAGAVMGLPAGNRNSSGGYEIEGRAQAGSLSSMPTAGFRVTTPDYFKTMGTALVRGRDFDQRDSYDAPLVAIVNQHLATREFSGEDPVGKRIKCGLDRRADEWMTIVGVVADVRHDNPAESAKAELYMAYEQHPQVSRGLHVVMRADADPADVSEEVRRRASTLNPEVSTSVTTMKAILADAVAAPRFRTALLVAFAVIAVLLAMAGVYGVMAYVVSERMSEFGLRAALGATAGDLLALVLSRALWTTGVGLGIGFALAALVSKAFGTLIYGLEAFDALTYAGAIAAVALAAMAAALVPALRCTRVDPMEALRAE